MSVGLLYIVRSIALALTIIFALVTLGLSAHFTYTTEKFHTYLTFAAMAIAVSVLTLLTLPLLFVIDCIRGAPLIVEVIWIGVLWVLWLSTGVLTINASLFTGGCSLIYSNEFKIACYEALGIEASSFFAWFCLKSYWGLLLIFSIIGSTRGHRIWTSTVKDDLFFKPHAVAGTGYPPQYQMAAQQYSQPSEPYAQTAPYPQQYPPHKVQYADPNYAGSNVNLLQPQGQGYA